MVSRGLSSDRFGEDAIERFALLAGRSITYAHSAQFGFEHSEIASTLRLTRLKWAEPRKL
jgi:hypothetical protein